MKEWRKSSYCGGSVWKEWRKSSYSGDSACVEVRAVGDEVQVRNSRDTDVVLSFTPTEWKAFIRGVRLTDEFDLLEP